MELAPQSARKTGFPPQPSNFDYHGIPVGMLTLILPSPRRSWLTMIRVLCFAAVLSLASWAPARQKCCRRPDRSGGRPPFWPRASVDLAGAGQPARRSGDQLELFDGVLYVQIGRGAAAGFRRGNGQKPCDCALGRAEVLPSTAACLVAQDRVAVVNGSKVFVEGVRRHCPRRCGQPARRAGDGSQLAKSKSSCQPTRASSRSRSRT